MEDIVTSTLVFFVNGKKVYLYNMYYVYKLYKQITRQLWEPNKLLLWY